MVDLEYVEDYYDYLGYYNPDGSYSNVFFCNFQLEDYEDFGLTQLREYADMHMKDESNKKLIKEIEEEIKNDETRLLLFKEKKREIMHRQYIEHLERIELELKVFCLEQDINKEEILLKELRKERNELIKEIKNQNEA